MWRCAMLRRRLRNDRSWETRETKTRSVSLISSYLLLVLSLISGNDPHTMYMSWSVVNSIIFVWITSCVLHLASCISRSSPMLLHYTHVFLSLKSFEHSLLTCALRFRLEQPGWIWIWLCSLSGWSSCSLFRFDAGVFVLCVKTT